MATATVVAHPLLEDRLAAINERLADTPDDPTLYRRRGDQFRLEGRHLLALADYNRAARLAPDLPGLDLSLGELYLEMGRPSLALGHFDALLAVEARHPGALIGRARSLAAAQRVDEAHRAFDLAIEASARTHPDTYLEWARFLSDNARREEALAVLDRALEELGPFTAFELAAVDLLLDCGRYDAAVQRLSDLADRSPRRAEWLSRRADLLESLGRFEEAREGYLEAQESVAALSAPARSRRSSQEILERIALGLTRLETSASSSR